MKQESISTKINEFLHEEKVEQKESKIFNTYFIFQRIGFLENESYFYNPRSILACLNAAEFTNHYSECS